MFAVIKILIKSITYSLILYFPITYKAHANAPNRSRKVFQTMQSLINGILRFQSEQQPNKQALFDQLASAITRRIDGDLRGLAN